jgi:hypothetical protein
MGESDQARTADRGRVHGSRKFSPIAALVDDIVCGYVVGVIASGEEVTGTRGCGTWNSDVRLTTTVSLRRSSEAVAGRGISLEHAAKTW